MFLDYGVEPTCRRTFGSESGKRVQSTGGDISLSSLDCVPHEADADSSVAGLFGMALGHIIEVSRFI